MTTPAILTILALSALPVEISVPNGLKTVSNSTPVVINVVHFTEASTKAFSREFQRAQKSSQGVIPVIINSYGGSVFSVLSMVDMIKASRKPVVTVAMGKAMSAGAVLLACGKKGMRYASPNAIIMVHEISAGAMGKNHVIKATAKEIDRINTKLLRLLAKCSGKPKNYFIKGLAKRSHLDWYMTAKEAKKHGLIDYIKVPTIKMRYIIETTVE